MNEQVSGAPCRALMSITLFLEPRELAIKSEQWSGHKPRLQCVMEISGSTYYPGHSAQTNIGAVSKAMLGKPFERRGGSECIWASPSS